MRDRHVTDTDPDRVSSRLLQFVFDLLRHHGAEPRTSTGPLPPWVTWAHYIDEIHHLGEVVGGAKGVAATMRATLDTAYSDLRALAGFFPGPVQFFAFVTHQLNPELVPGARGQVEMLSPHTLRVRYLLGDALVPGSQLYLEGTQTLVELFPTHVGLPEARVEVEELTDRTASFVAMFPDGKPKVQWGTYLEPRPAYATTASLTQREQEVLRLVCEGLTNAEIASALGTAPSTVKSQISSILAKMDVANRTELAALVSRS